LLQQGEHDLGKILALAASEYPQTQAAVEETVKGVFHHHDGGDDKLSKMIIEIILKNRMPCECHLSQNKLNLTCIGSF